ncbi:MAG TPA: hypothetical protein VLT36_16055 [Candidatus Dormibacteraeota bacterium]|nr:hypothetical protein [Candidatus Dormibacteraeota bacterium]
MTRLCLAFLLLAFCASAEQLEEHYADKGQLLIGHFESAPFPHPKRAEGHQYKQELFSAKDHYSDSTVAIFIPKGFRETGKIDFVVHFHGWRNHVQGVLERYKLNEQLVASKRNAVLIVPQGPYDAPDSFGGKLEDTNGFKAFMTEACTLLKRQSALKEKDFALGRIILSGHSGGYQVISSILDRGGLTEHVSEVWLFDALYAQTDKFLAWLNSQHGRLLDMYTEHGGTKEETEKLIATLKSRGHSYFAGKEEDADSALSGNRAIFMFSALEHNDVVDKHDTFRKFLETSCLASNPP